MRLPLASNVYACVGQFAETGDNSVVSEPRALPATSRDALLSSADNVREISWRSLVRPLFLRVYRLTVLVELRLNRFLIVFAIRAMACTLCSEGDRSHKRCNWPLRECRGAISLRVSSAFSFALGLFRPSGLPNARLLLVTHERKPTFQFSREVGIVSSDMHRLA